MTMTGMCAAAVGCALQIPARTVWGIIARYRDDPYNVCDRKRTGRPRISSACQDRVLALDARRNRFQTCNTLRCHWQQLNGIEVIQRTVCRRLNDARLHARRPLMKFPLYERHRQTILMWARRARHNIRYSGRVHFSDECRFYLHAKDGRIRVWGSLGERPSALCVRRWHAFQSGLVMVWGYISLHCIFILEEIRWNLNARRYCTEVLDTHVVPHFDARLPRSPDLHAR